MPSGWYQDAIRMTRTYLIVNLCTILMMYDVRIMED